ncbi:DUF6894 family protein [Rubellimicrobium rubrum]|uniref:DUF6894 family protein n=1 Tax=Rubellimicrobium rubrum TaxID=2585369 RepID=UPI003CCC6546
MSFPRSSSIARPTCLREPLRPPRWRPTTTIGRTGCQRLPPGPSFMQHRGLKRCSGVDVACKDPAMPRYFFHVESGARFHDDPGVAMAGPENARSEAVLAVGEMLRDIDGEFWAAPSSACTWSMRTGRPCAP